MPQKLVHVDLEVFIERILHNIEEAKPVLIVNEPVIENPIDLVHPEADELVSLAHVAGGGQENTSHHAREISQVEHIVRLGGRREEVGDSRHVYCHSGLHHDLEGREQNVGGKVSYSCSIYLR